jgi:hypothetical protein
MLRLLVLFLVFAYVTLPAASAQTTDSGYPDELSPSLAASAKAMHAMIHRDIAEAAEFQVTCQKFIRGFTGSDTSQLLNFRFDAPNSSRSCQPHKPHRQAFGPIPSPGTILTATLPSKSQVPEAT